MNSGKAKSSNITVKLVTQTDPTTGKVKIIAEGGDVDPIGGPRKQKLEWTFDNETNLDIDVRVHGFKLNKNPSNPFGKRQHKDDDFDDAVTDAKKPISGKGTKSAKFKGSIADNASGTHTYSIEVTDPSKVTHEIDPELQIDGNSPEHLMKWVWIGVLAAMVALLLARYFNLI